MKNAFNQIYNRFRSERGAASIIAVMFLALVGFGLAALVIDASILYVKRAEMVTAADAAALAGANVMREEVAKGLDFTKDWSGAKTKAINEATAFALANGADSDVLTVFVGERTVVLSDGKSSERYVVDVTVGVNQSNIFANFLGDPDSNVAATATATWGYVYATGIGNFLPIFTFDKDYKLDTDILLHEQMDDGPNYGYLDLKESGGSPGMDPVKEALAGRWLGGLYIKENTLGGQPGQGNSIPTPLEDRMKAAAAKNTPEERKAHMMGLVPIINWEQFNANPENSKNKHGAWDSHLELPIEYFAYFEIIDFVEKKGHEGSQYALNPANEYHPVTSYGVRDYQHLDGVGIEAATTLIIGRFTGEIVEARTLVESGDQTNPAPAEGGEDVAAMYAQLIH